MSEKKVIMYDDPALVEPVKVDAFKGADGKTYMSESVARWSCCTHIKCDNCGGAADRGYLLCDNCREAKKIDHYNQLKKQEWDGKTPIYCDKNEEYFFDAQGIYDFIDECKSNFPDEVFGGFRFLLCKPEYLKEVDEYYWLDDLPDGVEELPENVQEAINNLNNVIKNHKKPIAWEPSQIAVNYKIESGE